MHSPVPYIRPSEFPQDLPPFQRVEPGGYSDGGTMEHGGFVFLVLFLVAIREEKDTSKLKYNG